MPLILKMIVDTEDPTFKKLPYLGVLLKDHQDISELT